MRLFRFVDLFAGIGGFHQALSNLGGTFLLGAEIDEFARTTYQANFSVPEERLFRDVRDLTTETVRSFVGSVDVVTAGFPCQAFSLEGAHLGDWRERPTGQMFREVARVSAALEAPVVLMENVPRFYKLAFEDLREEFARYGYHVECQTFNAKPFVPQNRERLFMVAVPRNTPAVSRAYQGLWRPTPAPWASSEHLPYSTYPKLRSILHPQDGSEKPCEPYTHGLLGEVDPKYTLTDRAVLGRERWAARRAGGKLRTFGPDDVLGTLVACYSKSRRRNLIDQGPLRNPRRLTPRECARLMGFPDDFAIPVSDTQAYRQFGNSVVVPAVQELAKNVLEPVLPVC